MAARAFPRVCTILFALLVSSGLAATAADRGQEIAIIPLPARMEMASGSFTVERDTKLLVADHPQALAVAHYFGDLLFRTRGLRPEIVQPGGAELSRQISAGDIRYTLNGSDHGEITDLRRCAGGGCVNHGESRQFSEHGAAFFDDDTGRGRRDPRSTGDELTPPYPPDLSDSCGSDFSLTLSQSQVVTEGNPAGKPDPQKARQVRSDGPHVAISRRTGDNCA